MTVHDLSLNGMAINPGNLVLREGEQLCLCLSEQSGQCGSDHVIEATVVHLYHELIGLRFDTVGIHVLKDIHRLLRAGRNF